MIDSHYRLRRRMLTFRAVYPSEWLPPATLVDSLITQATRICHHNSTKFPTNWRNIRRTIRLINLLLLFFREIKETQPRFPNCILLSFSELHMTLRNIQLLLEDCTHVGARLFILISSETVTASLQFFVRSISIALEILPLQWLSSSVSLEISELLALMRKQSSRRNLLQLELEHQRVLQNLRSAINQLHNYTQPEWKNLKQIFDFLSIQSSNDYDKEIQFLMEQIEEMLSFGKDKNELPVLGNLVGFLVYGHSVLFPSPTEEPSLVFGNKSDRGELDCLNRDEFVCPISMQIMSDPVTVSTGQTYDRSSISKWFRMGNLTCPKTGKLVGKPEFVPNVVLRHIIHKVYGIKSTVVGESSSPPRDIFEMIAKESPAARYAFGLTIQFLTSKLALGTHEMSNEAVHALQLFGRRSKYLCSSMADSGAIPFLFPLISSAEPEIQSKAMATVLNLSKVPTGRKIIMAKSGTLERLLDVLENGLQPRTRQDAAAALYYLASVQQYNRSIGEAPATIPQLTLIIRDEAHCCRKNALLALYRLVTYQGNQRRILTSGVVPVLISISAASEKVNLKTVALAILSVLSRTHVGTVVILNSATPNLIVLMLNSSETAAEKAHCVSLLLSLCIRGGIDVISILATDASLMQLLYSQLVNGCPQARANANSLICMLHSFYNENCQMEQHIQVN